MASWQFDVTAYSVRLGKGGFGTLHFESPASITVYGGKDFRCIFRFVEDPQLPESVAHDRQADIFVHAAQYPWYIDLLRNERPVLCSINQSEPRFSYLSTGQEPTGEGEQVIRA